MLHTNFLLLLLILPLSIIADDSSSLQPQDLTPPITSSDADDALQRVTDSDLSPETLLAGIENNGVADCQSPPPGGRTRRSRLLRKRQTDFCSWQPYKGGAPTTTTSPQTGYDGAGTPLVPSTKIGPVDVKSPEEGKAPVSIPLGGTGNSEICGPSKETIPVCHWTPERLGSSRWLSPTLQLTPVRLCRFHFPPVLPSLIIDSFDGLTCGSRCPFYAQIALAKFAWD